MGTIKEYLDYAELAQASYQYVLNFFPISLIAQSIDTQ
jgi:hypothetical protein